MINISEKNMSFEEYLEERKINKSIVDSLLKKSDVIIIPAKLQTSVVVNTDLMAVSKIMKTKGLKVTIAKEKNQEIDVAEHRTADILLNVGIIVADKALDMLFAIAGMYIYDRYLKGKDLKEDEIPFVKTTYYDLKNGKFVERIERADKMPRK